MILEQIRMQPLLLFLFFAQFYLYSNRDGTDGGGQIGRNVSGSLSTGSGSEGWPSQVTLVAV